MSDLKHYETVVVFNHSLVDDAVKAELDKLAADIEGKFAGAITHREVWGKRQLAYPIHKAKEGIYAIMQYETLNGKVVDTLEQKLRINETVLRFLTVNRETELKRTKKGDAKKARRIKKVLPGPATGTEAAAATSETTAIPAPATVTAV
jgi:small subunit ribosomal protein S6